MIFQRHLNCSVKIKAVHPVTVSNHQREEQKYSQYRERPPVDHLFYLHILTTTTKGQTVRRPFVKLILSETAQYLFGPFLFQDYQYYMRFLIDFLTIIFHQQSRQGSKLHINTPSLHALKGSSEKESVFLNHFIFSYAKIYRHLQQCANLPIRFLVATLFTRRFC